jgi:hypothetical protein
MHTGEFEFVDGKIEYSEADADKLRRQLEFSEDCLKLGEVAVLVVAGEFMLRVKRAIDRIGYKFAATLVEYYDPKTFHGAFRQDKIPFRKRLEFSHQREYRIAVDSRTKGQDALEIEVGDISDISATMNAANLNKAFSLEGAPANG